MKNDLPASQCDPVVAREVLRAYVGGFSRNDRRRMARDYPRNAPNGRYVVQLTGDDGAIIFTAWELWAIAGDLLQ